VTATDTSPAGAGWDRDAAYVQDLDGSGLLGAFNRAGILAPADVHVALRLARLVGEDSEEVLLGVAFAVRAPRVGHVRVELGLVRDTAAVDVEDAVDVDALPWPATAGWCAALAASPLVAVGADGPDDRPLRLVGQALYLDRYWRDEGEVADELGRRASAGAPPFEQDVLADGLGRLFPGEGSSDQREAAAAAIGHRFSVIAGGPGTGKTTTVARVIALLHEQAAAAGWRPPLVALAAPTGKAANRMEEAVREEAGRMDVAPAIAAAVAASRASTLHRLLGTHPGNASRFRHHRHNRLPHDVVVVDETSMVSLGLMARLVEAVRSDARLVLVGDPEQLASVEAGAVLGDIVGPAPDLPSGGTQPPADAPPATPDAPIASAIHLLSSNYRFGGLLARLAAAVRAGDGPAVLEVLSAGDPAVEWLDTDPATASDAGLAPLRETAVTAASSVVTAARAGDGPAAAAALGGFRLLCAHRRGPAGVSQWNPRVESWVAQSDEAFGADGAWYVGRPVIVTANDYSLRLFNGDTGVVVARPDGGVGVSFAAAGPPALVSPSRLADLETVFAMTVHKAQGSEFDSVAVLLPAPDSRILTRELLYTALTRAQRRVIVVGTADSVLAAVQRRIARASGLTDRLWRAEPNA